MLVILSLLASMGAAQAQDEVVTTALPYTAHLEQACMWGGQPVACPQPEAEAESVEVPQPAPEDTNPWNIVTQTQFENTTSNQPEVAPMAEPTIRRSRGIRGTTSLNWRAGAGSSEPGRRPAVLDYDRNGNLIAQPGPADQGDVPGWAMADPARWETDQCGEAETDASIVCRRGARNRLALARAGMAVPVEGRDSTMPAPPPREPLCRQVVEPARDGRPASASLVCGNGDQEALAEMMREQADRVNTPAVTASCQRPMEGEDTPRWMARCQTPRP